MPHDGWHPHDHSHDDEPHAHRHDHHHHHHHGPPTRRAVLAAAALLPFGTASAQTADAAQRIAGAANRFLSSLDTAQRLRALIAFEADNRIDWHYISRATVRASRSARCSRRRPRRRARCSPRC